MSERATGIENVKIRLLPAARSLARHYGFMNEELDFIVNYDIKYRMGRDTGEEGRE